MDKLEYRSVIKFLTKEGKTNTEIKDRLEAVYGDASPSFATIKRWHHEFKLGRESIEDDPHTGRPKDVIKQESVDLVESLLLTNGRLRVKQLAEAAGISYGSTFTIIHDYLHLSKVSARWVPRMLTPQQKQYRVQCCESFLQLCGDNPDKILDRIVTGDETWVHHYDPESKEESKQWVEQGSRAPVKFKVTPSAGKIMATIFWDSEGILLIDYL